MRILIADDNQLVRRAIAGLLAKDAAFTLCGEASDSTEAMQKAAELHPDVVLLDVSMPGRGGFETARALKQKFPEIAILMVSQHDSAQMLSPSLEVGASGCVDKAELATDLLPAVRAVQKKSSAG